MILSTALFGRMRILCSDLLGSSLQLHSLELHIDRFYLLRSSFLVLRRMNRLQHRRCLRHLLGRRDTEDIAVEVDGAALPLQHHNSVLRVKLSLVVASSCGFLILEGGTPTNTIADLWRDVLHALWTSALVEVD
jgi:hypothetical protein